MIASIDASIVLRLVLGEAAHAALFTKSAIKRARLAGMQRNVAALTAEADRGILKS